MLSSHTSKYSIRTDPVALGHARQFRQLRKAFGMTRKDAAQRIGTSVQTISLLENHPECVSIRMWNKIARQSGYPEYRPPSGGNEQLTIEQERERAVSEEPQGVYIPRKDYEACLKVMKAFVKFLERQGGVVKDECQEDA